MMTGFAWRWRRVGALWRDADFVTLGKIVGGIARGRLRAASGAFMDLSRLSARSSAGTLAANPLAMARASPPSATCRSTAAQVYPQP